MGVGIGRKYNSRGRSRNSLRSKKDAIKLPWHPLVDLQKHTNIGA